MTSDVAIKLGNAQKQKTATKNGKTMNLNERHINENTYA